MLERSRLPVRRGFFTPAVLFDEFRKEMEKLFDWPTFQGLEGTMAGEWLPRVDIFRQDGEMVVKADLPGMQKKDVEVVVEEGDLILKGERKEETEVKEEDYYRCERCHGKFFRRMPLPEGIDSSKVSAKFVDGVLEVHLPMTEKVARAHKIQIH